jgi:hypothetical protein
MGATRPGARQRDDGDPQLGGGMGGLTCETLRSLVNTTEWRARPVLLLQFRRSHLAPSKEGEESL